MKFLLLLILVFTQACGDLLTASDVVRDVQFIRDREAVERQGWILAGEEYEEELTATNCADNKDFIINSLRIENEELRSYINEYVGDDITLEETLDF